MRILSGQSTLVTLSTGSGKSLCYQLPAYMYSRRKRCITLVISPLVSLMEDQVRGVPDFLNAQCLHTNLSEQKRAATIELIKAGKVDVLLISPEAVVACEKSTGFGSILRDLPPVAFVCIDGKQKLSLFNIYAKQLSATCSHFIVFVYFFQNAIVCLSLVIIFDPVI